jgi:hypothetical protein
LKQRFDYITQVEQRCITFLRLEYLYLELIGRVPEREQIEIELENYRYIGNLDMRAILRNYLPVGDKALESDISEMNDKNRLIIQNLAIYAANSNRNPSWSNND